MKKKKKNAEWQKYSSIIYNLALTKARKNLGYQIDISVYDIDKKHMPEKTDGSLLFSFVKNNLYFYCIIIRRQRHNIKKFFIKAHELGHLVCFSKLSVNEIKHLRECFRNNDKKYEAVKFEYEKKAFSEAYELMKEVKVPLEIRDLFVQYSVGVLDNNVKEIINNFKN